MAAPSIRIRTIPLDTAEALINLPALRIAPIEGESAVSSGIGNELNFGTADVSAGDKNTLVFNFHWDVTDDGGNTSISAFKWWQSARGFDQAGTLVKLAAICGPEISTPSNTENYDVPTTTTTYTFATIPSSEPSQNLWAADDGASMTLTGLNDPSPDTVMMAMYVVVKSLETTGIYKGSDSGKEFQFSFKYTYS
jgi:hypothetical protein